MSGNTFLFNVSQNPNRVYNVKVMPDRSFLENTGAFGFKGGLQMHQHEGYSHDAQKDSGRRNIGFAFVLNAFFVLVEIAGGIITGSIAIISDAVHDLGDSMALGLSWILEKRSGKKGNYTYTYGYRRLSLMGALFNSLVLLIGSVIIVIHAVPALFNPGAPDARGMIVFSLFGILINGFAVLKLRGGKGLAEKAVRLHLLEDVLGWAAVLVVSVIMLFAYVPVLDPILSLLITVFILKNVYRNLVQIIKILLQAVPDGYDIDQIKKTLIERHPVITDLHGIKLWTLDGETNIMTFHMCIKNSPDIKEIVDIKRNVKQTLMELGIEDVTIEIENLDNCSNNPQSDSGTFI